MKLSALTFLKLAAAAAVLLSAAGCAHYRLEPGARSGDYRIEATERKLEFSNAAGSLVFKPGSAAVRVDGKVNMSLPYPVRYEDGRYLIEKRLLDRVVSPWLLRSPRTVRTVMIDPGHGGGEPGAPGTVIPEKSVNLAVALKLKSELEKRKFAVLMTRDGDDTVPLRRRVGIADGSKSDIFVSIHHDSAVDRRARGYSIYARDNSKFTGESTALALAIQSEIVKLPQVADRGVRFADFRVLHSAMPAVLIELGFISNADEEKLMNSPARQQAEVSAIADGIENFCRGSRR